jgi:hypothetical protein
MATRTVVTLEDDLDGGPADEAVRFGLGSAEYEIDLNARNAEVFRAQFGAVYRARPQARAGAARPASSDAVSPAGQRRGPGAG